MNIYGLATASALALALLTGSAWASVGHTGENEEHSAEMTRIQMPGMMGGKMLALPTMDAERGRKLFAEKGCAVCHAVNGVGGEDAPPLDAATMDPMMNPFEFAARMWRGAEVMVIMQRDELGEAIEISGQDLADIIAFVHSHEEQAKFSEEDLPERMKELIKHDD